MMEVCDLEKAVVVSSLRDGPKDPFLLIFAPPPSVWAGLTDSLLTNGIGQKRWEVLELRV